MLIKSNFGVVAVRENGKVFRMVPVWVFYGSTSYEGMEYTDSYAVFIDGLTTGRGTLMKSFSLRSLRIDLKGHSVPGVFSKYFVGDRSVFYPLFCGYYKVDTLYAWTLLHDRAQAFLALLLELFLIRCVF